MKVFVQYRVFLKSGETQESRYRGQHEEEDFFLFLFPYKKKRQSQKNLNSLMKRDDFQIRRH